MSERVNPDLSKFEMRRPLPQVEEIVDSVISTLRRLDPPKSATVEADYSILDENEVILNVSGPIDDPEYMAWCDKFESENKDLIIEALETKLNGLVPELEALREMRCDLAKTVDKLRSDAGLLNLGGRENRQKAAGLTCAVERIDQDVFRLSKR